MSVSAVVMAIKLGTENGQRVCYLFAQRPFLLKCVIFFMQLVFSEKIVALLPQEVIIGHYGKDLGFPNPLLSVQSLKLNNLNFQMVGG